MDKTAGHKPEVVQSLKFEGTFEEDSKNAYKGMKGGKIKVRPARSIKCRLVD